MKKIIYNTAIGSFTKEMYQTFIKKYAMDITIKETVKTWNLVLLYKFIPLLVKGNSWEIKQNNKYKYVSAALHTDSLNRLIFEDYHCWISNNILSLSTLIDFLVTKIRRKKFGIRVKEWFFKKHNLLAILSMYTAKIIAKNSDFLIAHSEKSRAFIKNKLKVNDKKVYYIPKPWTDYSQLKYSKRTVQEIKNKFLDPNKKTILFVGRFMPCKGLDILFEAANKFSDSIRLLIVGDCNTKEGKYYQNLAREYGLDAIFTGRIGKEKSAIDIIYYYLISDLLILPNKYCPNEYEPLEIWGGVINESLALGTPVIVTTATGCANDLVKNKGTGVIVKQNSVKALEFAINDFLANPKKWAEMGKNGKAVVQQNNLNTYNGYVNLFEAINNEHI